MRACLIFILWGLWANVLAAGSLDSLDSQLAELKQDYAEKESTLTQAQRDLSLVQQRVRDATADLQTAQTQLVEEEEAFKLAQSYALRKKMAIDAKAEAEYKAAVNKKELAADNLQRRQRAESEAIAYVQKLQADVQGLSSAVNRVGNDVAVARFEVMREKFEKETEVIVELRFSCGEEVTTKQCREMGRNAADEKAQKIGAVSLLKSVTEADLARLQVTENKVKEELIALVMRRKQLEPEESVKNGEYYGKWSMWVKGQVPESLRPQAGAVLVGGKIAPVTPIASPAVSKSNYSSSTVFTPKQALGVIRTKGYLCMSCHEIEGKLVGPGFKTVADKYKCDTAAPDILAKKVKSGGVGMWGQIPMPPNSAVSEIDMEIIIGGILSYASCNN
ncbi:MAG: hypothetical protein PHP00_09885 [Thiotrichaceae bacterium]|nr:hypothetical protein [Thiotrichaceae bacterium]